jgi:hypothetical protein
MHVITCKMVTSRELTLLTVTVVVGSINAFQIYPNMFRQVTAIIRGRRYLKS